MRIQFMAFLLVAAMLLITIPLGTEAQVIDSVTYLMGDIPQGKIVGGIVHNITIQLTQPAVNVTLRAYLDGGFTASNYSTNYSWTYDSGVWTDNLHDFFLKPESNIYGNYYCFHISLHRDAYPGTWRWIVDVDGVEEYNMPMLVVIPNAGIEMSAPTFYPDIYPYGEGYYNSSYSEGVNNSKRVRTTNIGNVPLDLTITYSNLNGLFKTSNCTEIFLPGEVRYHFVEFQAQSWSPRKFTVKGLIEGVPQLEMTPDTISCIVAPRTTFDVVVTVARQGYEVYQMEGVTVQYKEFYTSKFKDDLTLDMYLSGNRSVYLSGDMDRLTMNFMEFQEEQYTEPLLMELSDDFELHVLVNITCSDPPSENQASILAHAYFDLELEYNSAMGRFGSTVVVASIPYVEEVPILEANLLVILVLVGVFAGIGFILFMARRKAEIDRRDELEERIRQKKDDSRRKR